MILPPDLAAALGQLPFAQIGKRHSFHGHAMAEIQRLTAPSTAGGVAATGACVEPIAVQPVVQLREPQAQPRRQPQLVPIDVPVFEDGPYRVGVVLGWTYV